MQKAVQHLHDDYRKRGACWVYKAGDDNGQPLLEIRFSGSQSHPSASDKAGGGKVRYALGLYAQVGSAGADLFFLCPTRATSSDTYVGDTKYVKAEFFADATRLRGNSVDKDRMVILNAISRKVAQEAGCAAEAHLPATVPDP
ncbi:hypothetical protein [Streptomyces sp. SID161]|uniref:hypothetical protein n=1 Tax=Streptomyces sp. SID161 TaxID=2690251 RepID=UPI0013686774|nr:hypothetical protein [Streptomyces sp. SID161]MYW47991.1 hypothetical protein [Streptomyces sp. SID161]